MPLHAGQPPRGRLGALVVLGICNHVMLTGTRVAVALQAIALGASPMLVGTLVALFALLPVFCSVPAGRLADRIGARRPMLWGSAGCALAALLPALAPGLPALWAAALLAGVAFMLFQIPAQRAVGDLADAPERASNYSWYALGFSVSGFAGPLAAGAAIEALGYRSAFALLALLPLAAVVALARNSPGLPPPAAPAGGALRAGAMRDLLRHPVLRRVLALNALFALGWDLHTIFVPVYGTQIGLGPTAIGGVLSAFAAATFVVRLAMPWLARRAEPMRVLRVALTVSAAAYLAFPFTSSALALFVLSFLLGLGLGGGQPMVLALLHEHAPPRRVGEVVGLRMSMIQSMAVGVPVVFGALGTGVGLAPVFGAVALLLGLGGLAARRAGDAPD